MIYVIMMSKRAQLIEHPSSSYDVLLTANSCKEHINKFSNRKHGIIFSTLKNMQILAYIPYEIFTNFLLNSIFWCD